MFKFCPFCGSEYDNCEGYMFDCKVCKKTLYINSEPAVSVVATYKDQVLIGKRGKDPFKGKYEVIGGFLEAGEHPLDGAVREFKEETGYLIDKSGLSFLTIRMGEYLFQGRVVLTHNTIYTIQFKEKPILKASDDVANLFWIRIEDINKFDFAWDEERQIVESLRKDLK